MFRYQNKNPIIPYVSVVTAAFYKSVNFQFGDVMVD
jgi:hypothetical protein